MHRCAGFSRIFLLLVLALALFLPQSAGARTRWKVATLAPKGLGWAVSYDKLINPWLAEATDNEVVTKVYWGGIMGNDDDYIRKMRIGQLQGAGCTGVGANLACPEFSVVGLPFLFNDYDEVDYIRAVMYPTFDYYFLQNGYKLALWIDQDFDHFFSTKYKFDKLEDFARSDIVTWYGPQEAEMLKALGANPIPMDVTDIPTGKRTGVIDTNIAPSIWQVGAQLYMVDKYVNTMNIRYSPAVIIVTKEVWEALPSDYREKIMDRREEVQKAYTSDIRRDNEKCLEAMIEYGVQEVSLDPASAQVIIDRAMKVYDDFSGDLYPVELLQEVKRHLAAYRRGKPAAKPAPVITASTKKPAPKPAPVKVATPKTPPPAPKVEKPAPPAPPVVETPPEPEAPVVAVVEEKVEVAVTPAAPEEAVEEVTEEENAVFIPPPPEVAKVDLNKMAAAYQETEDALKKAAEEKKAEPVVEAKPVVPKRSAWEERKRQLTEVQKTLKSMGLYNYAVDGIYGPITRRGIMEYQRMNGLKATGAVDETLLKRMGIE